MYKLIACDMDETLLNDDKIVSQDNCDAISAARAKGVKFVLASGRGFPAMQPAAKVLNLANHLDEFTISFNGGVITENHNNRTLAINGISFEQMQTLFHIGLDYDVGFHIYTLSDVYMYRMSEDERTYVQGRLDGYIELSTPDLNFLKEATIIKILFHHIDRDYLASIERNIPQSILSQFSVSYSGNRYLEFNQQGVSKGVALLKLIKMLNIEPEEVIAIGDNNNDISMLKVAGLGVAVANATADAKAAANTLCELNHNQSAVADIIQRYILNSYTR